jgi:DNA invertase Pin-like site-specific DNA recombinase
MSRATAEPPARDGVQPRRERPTPIPDPQSAKIRPAHLERQALVYVRQSSPQQVLEHRESRERQYALAGHAVALGWSSRRVTVIDEDQGHSGSSAADRPGFQRLLSEVTLNQVGIVLGLEMSRLARSSKDFHQLIEACAIFGTLLADQDGVYDPAEPNDRLLLGLRGTISEVEIHTMRNRLDRGRLNKAARGELFFRLPTGYAFSPTRQVVLEPDEQARGVVRLVFEKFAELGSVYAVFHELIRHDIRLGMRAHSGPQRGDLVWRRPRLSMLYHVLHNPIYAGAYAYGRRVADPRLRKPHRPKTGCRAVPMAQWKVLRLDCLPSYISWEQYVENQRRLAANHFGPTTPGVARQGRALLGGLVVCGECGRRMQVSYRESEHPTYKCTWYLLEGRPRSCPPMAAGVLDPLVERQLLRALEPAALELSLRAGADVEHERQRLLELAQQDVERARYEAHRAERQYQSVEPENRLVGRELERRWEEALVQQRRAEEAHARRLQAEPPRLSDEERARILAFSADLPALWAAPTTTAADRKSILRTLIERVTVEVRDMTEYASVAIRWAGGFISRHELIRRVRRYDQMRDFPQLLDRLVELRGRGLSIPQIADQLNEEGFRTTKGAHFHEDVVRQLPSRRGLGDERKQPGVLGPHEWWLADLSRASGVRLAVLRAWAKKGWFHSRKSPVQGLWIVWADGPEMDRLRRLAACSPEGPFAQYPAELTTPRDRP